MAHVDYFLLYKFQCLYHLSRFLHGQIGFKFSAPGYYYKPDDLLTIFKDNIYFEGNLLDYCSDERIDEQYFAPMSFEVAKKSAKCFGKIVGRSIFCRGDDYFKNKEMFWDKNNFH